MAVLQSVQKLPKFLLDNALMSFFSVCHMGTKLLQIHRKQWEELSIYKCYRWTMIFGNIILGILID